MRKHIQGVALMSAIFILVVLSLVASAAIVLVNNSTNSTSLSVLEVKAYYAARAGLEFTAATAKGLNNCPVNNPYIYFPSTYIQAGSTQYTNGNMEDTFANVLCTKISEVTESGKTVRVLSLSSVGVARSQDFGLHAQRNINMNMVVSCTPAC